MSIQGLHWPGDGTYKLAAEDVRPFTVHEFVKPALEKMAPAKSSDPKWLSEIRAELTGLADGPDRNVTPNDFAWAAFARCRCGAGYAYPEFLHDPQGNWFCSASLLGTATEGSEHDCAKPFAFWNIKSDKQPSAGGATTRPQEAA